MIDRPFLSVKQICELLALSEHAVLGLIRSGELRAIDVSQRAGGKPRWRILPDDLDGFISRRSVTPSPMRKQRRRKAANVIEYF